MVGAELTKLLQSLAMEYFTPGTFLCAEARNKAAARQTAYERLQEITEMSFTHPHVDSPPYSSLILMHSSPQLSHCRFQHCQLYASLCGRSHIVEGVFDYLGAI